MTMETNLAGRLRNTSLPMSSGLLPLYEAVVNSIHAIEEAGLSACDGGIAIEIIRNTQVELNFEEEKKSEDRRHEMTL